MSEENRSLAKLVKDFNAIDELLMGEGGEVSATLEEWMKINELNLADKVDGYKLYMDHCESMIGYFKEVEGQYYKAKKMFENQIVRMKENIKLCMQNMMVDELKGHDFRFKLSKEDEKTVLVIEDASAVPAKFTMETIVMEPDKELIMKTLKENLDVPGCKLETKQKVSLKSYINASAKKKPTKEKK